jgi:hypothetical protein
MRVLAAVGLWAVGVQSQSQGAQLPQQLPPASCSSSESSESRSENRSENRFRIQYQCSEAAQRGHARRRGALPDGVVVPLFGIGCPEARVRGAKSGAHRHAERRQELESPLRWAGAAEEGKIGKLCVPNWRGNLNSDDGNRRSRRGHCPVGVRPCVESGASWRLLGRWEGCRIPYAPLAAGWPAAAVVLGVGGVSGPEGGPGYLCKKGRQKGEARHGVCGC